MELIVRGGGYELLSGNRDWVEQWSQARLIVNCKQKHVTGWISHPLSAPIIKTDDTIISILNSSHHTTLSDLQPFVVWSWVNWFRTQRSLLLVVNFHIWRWISWSSYTGEKSFFDWIISCWSSRYSSHHRTVWQTLRFNYYQLRSQPENARYLSLCLLSPLSLLYQIEVSSTLATSRGSWHYNCNLIAVFISDFGKCSLLENDRRVIIGLHPSSSPPRSREISEHLRPAREFQKVRARPAEPLQSERNVEMCWSWSWAGQCDDLRWTTRILIVMKSSPGLRSWQS